ncbi:hypothetical protein CLF_106351 [Clonorchis sinensis]|uniref:Transposable element Tc3 transposase n=1 Tax=Clonorchis sinensis TaxID=79923 RepID=G7YF04_CLOSI|nr:hypothetical protein CLF_106351 [Clonorchis sinensis]
MFAYDVHIERDIERTHVIPQLKQHKKSSTVFHQDGSPPHYSTQVRTYLREQFSDERVIARGFPNFWLVPEHHGIFVNNSGNWKTDIRDKASSFVNCGGFVMCYACRNTVYQDWC